MTKFYVHGENWETGVKKIFEYDTSDSSIKCDDNSIDLSIFSDYKGNFYKKVKQFSKDLPIGKSNVISKLKIQLGLKCNYTCDYCSQAAHVEGSIDFTPSDIDSFMTKLTKLDLSQLTMIEFWGGEPFVYWKTLKVLTEKLREKYTCNFLIITNGSVLSDEIIDFIENYDISIAISHDGKNQKIRGPDPFDDPIKRDLILKLFKKRNKTGKISFNSVLHKDNISRAELLKFFEEVTNDKNVKLGEGAFIDSYNDGGENLSLYDYKDMINFRRNALSELQLLNRDRVHIFDSKVKNFIKSVVNNRSWHTIGQKCGMDRADNIAINMQGDVLTCQNVSANMKSFNGESHKIGNIDDIDNVKLNTGTHWSLRKECNECPVLHLCGGSCFMLEGKHWQLSCDNAYNDNIVFFMYAFEVLTGYIPYWIDGNIPEWRKDILGMQYPDLTRPKNKVIPIMEITS